MKIPFYKQYRYVINHLHLYATKYYICLCTITLFLLTMCHYLVSTNISWNTTFTTIAIFSPVSRAPMGLFIVVFSLVWDLYVNFGSNLGQHAFILWGAYLFLGKGQYYEGIYTSAPAHIVDSTEFMRHKEWHFCFKSVHELICIWDIYVVFEGLICCTDMTIAL